MSHSETPDIIYTKVDEAPELASASLLPIVQRFAKAAGIRVGSRDISLAGRIVATFSDELAPDQRLPDDLAALGDLVKQPHANVIKLPNISASEPQLVAAVKELQAKGFALPDYPYEPKTDAEKAVRAKYDTIKGSAVNPVLREGNSDRRAAGAVKKYAQDNPHRMGDWDASSKTRVASMQGGDFFSNEVSATLDTDATARIVLETADGETMLKEGVFYPAGTVVDATYMSAAALDAFLAEEIEKSKTEGTLFSLHMKATMMKVSDPIIFGHAVRQFLQPVFDKYGDEMKAAGVDPNSGLGALLDRVSDKPEIVAEIERVMAERPPMYMVDSGKGITNLHVPSDVIIDASMPALIKAGGKGWGPDDAQHDTNCVIPDNSYAPVYDETIKFFKENGKLDPATAGTVQNLGLMAQKAEEYGSHPTTFEIPQAGAVKMILDDGTVLHQHTVQAGDIWRSASARKAPIEDWVKLAIDRQQATGYRAIFWLDEARAHDAELIRYVKPILQAAGVEAKFEIMAPREATRASLETITKGENTIAITGNVLRDYLTDLFPILELATSAKMLSIVKLMNGGGLFETGAGGSAPKHVQQLHEENHLRWDSLGEFCALGESFKFLADQKGNEKARVLGNAVEAATQGVLDHDRSPSRKVGEPDNRDSHYWFARYWAEALAAQADDADLAAEFAPLAKALSEGEAQITGDLAAAQGRPADTGGYYMNDDARLAQVMRPSATLNDIIG
ncbi:NADP-dependent isocitrate dehydrogenase [Salibaculum sp.]|uniref:NADP-dependent isocitrate dehydrogenase n=1 Tax=Salibaculum sp. TaxID=2855480 RepID=UPI002B45F1D9|nr:NADP-dependent isocitrate dehydrogenase [Salibaculum sp.]HKL70271.1 NADP-dependent isocitrate dehydrogenase [Salibaculum sp.]